MRRTKIVATLGPASDSAIEDLARSGVDVFRVNFSHGSLSAHARRIRAVRATADRLGRFLAVMADLQGPKIRIGGFANTESIELAPGDSFAIDSALGAGAGTEAQVSTTYRRLAADVSKGDVLVMGDGLIELEVVRSSGARVECRVVTGGALLPGKGINKRMGGLSAPALSRKDESDLAFACECGVDYVAVSFPRSAADMARARQLVDRVGANCRLVAKVERAEAVADEATLDNLIRASDSVMVARGDLGIEIGDAALMAVQKRVIERARTLNRSVITATQMMDSMIHNPRPTRAEVMDVANAVVDGTDAVMLSAETAVGRYPVETVQTMVRVIEGAEATEHLQARIHNRPPCDAIDEAVALAAMTAAANLSRVRALACLTATGNTPRLMSRIYSTLPIYALAADKRALARVALFRGVQPVLFETGDIDDDLVNEAAIRWLKRDGAVSAGDRVILSKGDFRNVQGGTNTLKIVEVT